MDYMRYYAGSLDRLSINCDKQMGINLTPITQIKGNNDLSNFKYF